MKIVGCVIKTLHQAKIPNHHSFPHIKDWLSVFDEELKIPGQYLNKARQLRDHLLETSDKDCLLHGDLHHDNILQFSKDWITIDPKGVIGESAYEVAAFIRNPIPQLLEHDRFLDMIHHRIRDLSEILGLSERRLIDWCFVQAVLAWAWALEDRCETHDFEKLSKIFYDL